MKRNTPLMKTGAWLICCCFIAEFAAPCVSHALTSGPAQPEFTSFEPVATTGMVNELTGGFTYNLPVVNIPGANGGGYALSLSYHSNVTAAEDASWVGYGWSLNPGAINRGKRGFPDDFHSTEVEYYNKAPKNETYTVGLSASGQAASLENIPINAGISEMIRYNTNTGWSSVQGYSLSISGALNFGYRIEDGYGKFSLNVSPLNLVALLVMKQAEYDKIRTDLHGSEIATAMTVEQHNEIVKTINGNILFNTATSQISSKLSAYLNNGSVVQTMPAAAPKYTGAFYLINNRTHTSIVPGAPAQAGPISGQYGSYTWQQPISKQTKQAFGYMYTGAAHHIDSRDDAVVDYMTEKSGSFTRKDRYLGIPFSNADNFAVSGEGLSGVFRMHNRRVGIFHPNRESSKLTSHSVGFEPGIGSHWAIGFDYRVGFQRVNIDEWHGLLNNQLEYASYVDSTESWYDGEPYFFRFNGDKGGRLVFDGDNHHIKTEIASGFNEPLQDLSKFYTQVNEGERVGRSSLICYNTNAEMLETHGGVNFRSFTRDSMNLHGHVKRDDEDLLKQIGEIAILNRAGNLYQYGLPVYSRNERSMRFIIENGTTLNNTFLFTSHHEDSHNNVSGQTIKSPYASSYLLTAITSPSYLDRTGDGPTADDFGGYTRFDYRRTAGTRAKPGEDVNDKWYKWRSPYVGFHYDPGKLITAKDNSGTVASGEKELYYLRKVETKSHVAYFVCNKTADTVTRNGLEDLIIQGSGDERLDSYEAYRNISEDAVEEEKKSASGKEYEAYDGYWSNELSGRIFEGHSTITMDEGKQSETTPNKAEFLERIEVYAKNEAGDPEKLLRTVHFEYDYSLMYSHPKHPGAYFIHKDTLKADDGTDSLYLADTIYHDPSRLNSAANFTVDGVPDVHASTHVTRYRHGKLTLKRVWMEYEGVVNARISPYDFDYTYKCDKSSHYAAKIRSKFPDVISATDVFSDSCSTHPSANENPEYTITKLDRWGHYNRKMSTRRRNHNPYVPQNIREGYDDPAVWHLKRIRLPSGGEINIQYERNSYCYVQDQPAMAMVKLFDLKADEPIFGKNTYRCYLDVESELGITGTDELQALANKVRAELGKGSGERIYFRFLYKMKECELSSRTTEFPLHGCDYVTGYSNVVNAGVTHHSQKDRLWVELQSDITPVDVADEYIKTNQAKDYSCSSQIELEDADYTSADFWEKLLVALPVIPILDQIRNQLFDPYATKPIYEFSYLRIPLTQPKIGGGVRVKRLLMYDEGMESGDAVLYGTEYIYENEDGSCSGVAVNEPSEGREANSVIRYLKKRDERNIFEELASGFDMQQFEGLLGESLLPAPAVNYGRVVSQNIHSGKTGTGYAVSEFYTARDYPIKASNNDINLETKWPDGIQEILFQSTISRYYATQSYVFEVNGMHGQPKRIAKYGGLYNPENNQSDYLVESVEFEYFAPGEKIPVFNGVDQPIEFQDLGKQLELLIEARSIEDRTDFVGVLGDAGITFPSAFFLPQFFLTFTGATYKYDEAIVKTYVTNKVIHYPVFQKSITTKKNGIEHKIVNMAFDEGSGEPVVTINADAYDALDLPLSSEHSGTYAQYNFPAWQHYPSLGQAAENYRLRGKSATYNSGSKSLALSNPEPRIYVGDQIKLRDSNKDEVLLHVTGVSPGASSLNLQLMSFSVDIPSGTVEWEIIRSGKQNQVGVSAGALTTYGRDSAEIVSTSDLSTLSDNVISASSTIFSDYWPYDAAIYGEVNPDAINTPTDYETGVLGRWRPYRSYVFRGEVESGVSATNDRNYANAGVLSGFSFFDWEDTSNNGSDWIGLSEITQLSPHGEVLEEVDILGIPSAAHFGHRNQVATMVAANSEHGSLVFRSFEEGDGNSAGIAHSGRNSFKLNTSGYIVIDSVEPGQRLRESGAMVFIWTKGGASTPIAVRVHGSSVGLTKIAQTGEWTLYEGTIAPNTLPTSGSAILLEIERLEMDVFVDDVRMQPLDAQATCYVYDANNLRLVTQFDDQHFGLYYQYSAEGKLTRRIIESVDGMKTVQETQYHTPLIARSSVGLGGAQPIFTIAPNVLPSSRKYLKSAEPSLNHFNDSRHSPQRGINGGFDILQLNNQGDKNKLIILNMDTLELEKKEGN